MFASPTVFIVGAGASCELGLPSGEDLKQAIARLLDITYPDGFTQATGDYQIAELYRRIASEQQTNSNTLLSKGWRIRDALPLALSIDNVLDAHADDKLLEQVGKLAIVKAILAAERSSKLFISERRPKIYAGDLQDTWLVGFFRLLTESCRKEAISTLFSNVTIITFNYDRCIEQFLPYALAEYYDLEFAEAQELAGQLTILHAYGKVGDLPRPGLQETVPFGADRANILDLTNHIRTFSESTDSQLTSSIREKLAEAETIVFLGFAYHPMNMQLLQTTGFDEEKRVFGTSYGLSEADGHVVEEQLSAMFEGVETTSLNAPLSLPERHVILSNEKCGTFIRNYFRSISGAG